MTAHVRWGEVTAEDIGLWRWLGEGPGVVHLVHQNEQDDAMAMSLCGMPARVCKPEWTPNKPLCGNCTRTAPFGGPPTGLSCTFGDGQK